MRRTVYLVAVLLLGPSPLLASTLFDFTVTGDGHTFQFSLPNPPTITDHPHNVTFGLGPVSGTADGGGGYSLDATFIALGDNSAFPSLVLDVNPLPPGVTRGAMYGDSYQLYGPIVVSLVSDVPNPNPLCCAYPNDLLTFAFVPDDYTFYGFDPDHSPGYYSVDIAAVGAGSVAPEPASWWLALTGALGVVLMRWRSHTGSVIGGPA